MPNHKKKQKGTRRQGQDTVQSNDSVSPLGASPEHSEQTSFSVQEALARRQEKRAARSNEKAKLMAAAKEKGNKLFNAENYEGAVTVYSEAIKSFGPSPVVLSNLSAAHLKLENYADAEQTATTALRYDPRMIKARYRRGIARMEMFDFKAAMMDFQTVVREDPTCVKAVEQLAIAKKEYIDFEQGLFDDSDEESSIPTSQCDWPSFDEDPFSEWSGSDTSDYRHSGNGFPCRFYNHGGCSRREDCRYSHAPDGKSMRDNLGRNVCAYFLLDMCKFGSNCAYSHEKAYLPPGVWDDEDKVAEAKEILAHGGEDADLIALNLISQKKPKSQNLSMTGERGSNQETKTEGANTEKSGSSMPSNQPFIMLLALDYDTTADYMQPLLRKIAAKRPLKKASSAGEAMKYLSSLDLAGVFVADAGITEPANERVLKKLAMFSITGGSVVIGGSFSTFVRPDHMKAFFEKAWGLSWESGSYHRTTFYIGDSHELAKNNPSLLPSFSMKALHLKGTSPDVAVYNPTRDSKIESMVFAPDPITDFSESPIVHTRVGNGHLGYIGDVNWEDGSSKVILAMLGLLDTFCLPTSLSQPSTTMQDIPKDTQEASGSQSKTSKPFVMLLSLENEDLFASTHEHFLNTLSAKIDFVRARTPSSALENLASSNLAAVFVTDSGIVKSSNAKVLSKLVQYTKSGGHVVVGGLFSTFIAGDRMNTFFKKTWGLSWQAGSYHRTTFSRNPFHDMVKKTPSLPESYNVKALNIGRITADDAVYLPTGNSRTQSMVFPPMLITNYCESPVVQTRIGSGYFGYIGDVNGEDESTNIILAMLGLADFQKGPGVVTPAAQPKQGTVRTALVKPKPRPFIIVLCFGNERFLCEIQGDLLGLLEKKTEVLYHLSEQRVLDLIGSPDLVGIMIAGLNIVNEENAYLLEKIVAYTKAGGTVIIGGAFSSLVTVDKIEPFFSWGLQWRGGDYTRTDININKNHPLVKKNATSMSSSLRMKALHISGITPEMAVYVPSQGSHIYSPLNKLTQAAIVHTQVGQGYLGYLGDVGFGEEHNKIVLSMFGLLD